MFKEGRIYLENHNEAGCFVCTGISPPLSSLADLNFTPSHQPEQLLLLPPEQLQELQARQSIHHHSHQPQNEKYGLSSIFAGGKLTQMVKETSASFVSGSKKLAENVKHINIDSILPKSSELKAPSDGDEEVDVSGLGTYYFAFILLLFFLMFSC
jgi:hypothetical protein